MYELKLHAISVVKATATTALTDDLRPEEVMLLIFVLLCCVMLFCQPFTVSGQVSASHGAIVREDRGELLSRG